MSELIAIWRRLFADGPVDVRHLIELADREPDLAAALLNLLGSDAASPTSLRRVLSRHENRPFTVGDADVRLARIGYRWRVTVALSYAA